MKLPTFEIFIIGLSLTVVFVMGKLFDLSDKPMSPATPEEIQQSLSRCLKNAETWSKEKQKEYFPKYKFESNNGKSGTGTET